MTHMILRSILLAGLTTALLTGCGAPDDGDATHDDDAAGSQAQGLSYTTVRPPPTRFDKCCANCGGTTGSACNTCNSPGTNPITGVKFCPALQTPANCDSNGDNCTQAPRE